MFKSLKCFELTRHHMYTKFKRVITDKSEKNESNFYKLSQIVFSSTLSLFISYLAKNYFLKDQQDNTNPIYDIAFFAVAVLI